MKNKKRVTLRSIVQISFFVLIALIAINHTLAESGKGIAFLSAASLHALCPFGGITSIYQFLTSGTLVKKLHESSMILMTLGIVLAVLFGPLFCGFVCPLGTFQELVAKLGRKIFKKKYNQMIPIKYDRYLRYLRYGVLAWVSYMTAVTGKLSFEEVDPYFALFNFWSSEVAIGGIIVLLAVILASLFVERPWCKYACPYGAFLGVFNLLRIFKIKRNASTCISCNACDKVCPMNIKVSDKEIVRDHQCISCMKCTSEEACPINNTVGFNYKAPGEGWMNSKIVGAAVIIILFGGIAISSMLNIWNTESTKTPVKFASGEFAGKYNPEDIRGSYTFNDIKNSFDLPLEDLAKAFGVSGVSDIGEFQVKQIETMYEALKGTPKEIGTSTVRYFVALYKGLPYNTEEGAYLPKPAADILKSRAKLTEEQVKYIDSHLVDVPGKEVQGTEKSEISVEESVDKTVKGNTTFSEITDWGVSKEAIEKVINGKIPTPGMTIRDYCLQNGIEFSTVKEPLQQRIDEVNKK